MNTALELSVIGLLLNASLFTKLIMLFLLGLSIMSWAIILNKYLFVSRYQDQITKFLRSLNNQANLANVDDSSTQFSAGAAKTMPILLMRLVRSSKQGTLLLSAESVVNNALMHESGKLREGMNMLAVAANISPLLGLLGTVWGIMYSFINIGEQGSASIAAVAPGIAEALMTTIAGLLVAVPAMAGHNLLSGYINDTLDVLDRVGEYTLSILKVT